MKNELALPVTSADAFESLISKLSRRLLKMPASAFYFRSKRKSISHARPG